MRIGEAAATEVRHRVGLAPHDVVEDPEIEVLQSGTDAKDVVVRADHPERRGLLHDATHREQPRARERVVVREARELVPVVVDRIDETLVRAREPALELEVVGRIGEDEIDALGRQLLQRRNAVADEDVVDGEGGGDERRGFEPRPRSRRDLPGTRDLNPGGGAGGPGTRGTHG